MFWQCQGKKRFIDRMHQVFLLLYRSVIEALPTFAARNYCQMKKRSNKLKRIGFIAVGLLSVAVLYFSYAYTWKPAADNKQLLSLIMGGISAVHYSPRAIDDAFSEKIFTEFLNRADYDKKIFTQKDIDQLNKYKDDIDNEILDTSYEFFDAVMKVYNERIQQVYRYSKLPLASPLDFASNETLETDGNKLSYAEDTNELRDQWRKYMKLQVLQQLYDENKQQQTAKEKSDTVKLKSFAALEQESRTSVGKNNEDFFRRVHEFEYNDWMAVYLDCIANIEDPHTEYFPPVEKQNFDIEMTGQLEGIGAQLQERDGEIKVANIVPGSASWKQGQLKAGDIILKVAQGAEEPVNIEGMRLDKAIQLIRGKKGTEVRLTVKKPDGAVLVIPIIRDIVIIEATYAQSALINSDGQKIGYIRLPGFYTVLDQGGRSCADDVKKELLKLESENVAGIILDLRDNGGGSLQEAVNLAGLFISSGPIVQIRQRGANAQVMADSDPSVVYSGPLTIMVNGNSASASEIVAAALQDYHRAVIIGSNTFGKGTVQNVFNLDDFVSRSSSSAPSLGSLKVTIRKFYRINGGSTQLKGVAPDITLPDPYAAIDRGEKEDPFAIGWDEIAPAKYDPMKPSYNLNTLVAHSQSRVSASTSFKLIQQEAEDYKQRHDETSYSLNYEKFSSEQQELDAKEKKYDAITADSMLVPISNLSVDLPKINADSVSIARNTQFLKNLRKDVYLFEAAQVVSEMK